MIIAYILIVLAFVLIGVLWYDISKVEKYVNDLRSDFDFFIDYTYKKNTATADENFVNHRDSIVALANSLGYSFKNEAIKEEKVVGQKVIVEKKKKK